jgi:hypothetical protein
MGIILMESVVRRRKFRISGARMGCILFIIFGLILFLHILNNISWMFFYDSSPQGKITEENLVGTWELTSSITTLITKTQSSLIILKQDGNYEIHNPPKYLKKFCDLQQKKLSTVSCGQVATGEWLIITLSITHESNVVFEGTTRFAHRLRGRSNPYQLWYCEGDADVDPMYKWKKISKETKCPYCQYNLPVTEGKHVKHIVH